MDQHKLILFTGCNHAYDPYQKWYVVVAIIFYYIKAFFKMRVIIIQAPYFHDIYWAWHNDFFSGADLQNWENLHVGVTSHS